MADEIRELESPIDAMYLIHKALRAEATRAEKLVNQLEEGSALQSFKLSFNSWATALVFHAEMEDVYITEPLIKLQPSGDENGRTIESVKMAMVAQEEKHHQELMVTVEDVLMVLNEEIGKTSVITRTKQHLHRQVLALRIAQEDHLDTEEALVLPLVQSRFDEAAQLGMMKGLLLDELAQDQRWVLDWLCKYLSPDEQKLLSNLESRFFNGTSAAAG